MTRRIFYLDLLERAAWTFAEGFATVWLTLPFLADIAGGGDVDLSAGRTVLAAAVAGGLMSVLALVKGAAASRVGDRNSAATLPSPPDHASA